MHDQELSAMTRARGAAEVDDRLAEAAGVFILTEATLTEAADAAGVTRWELEDSLVAAGLAEPLGIDQDGDVASDLDALFDDQSV